MVTVCVLIGLGLFIGGIVIASATRGSVENRGLGDTAQLPDRSNTPLLTASQLHTRNIRSTSPPGLPPRRLQLQGSNSVVVTSNAIAACCGPRGVQPAQFPCCPFDKLRNIPGEQQRIFWDNQADRYYCSRGHRFKRNGKPH